MADTKLTVSMILNSASFTKQIKDVNNQLKLAESEFKNVSSGVEGFENSMSGLQAKMATLTTKISLQNEKVSKYRTEIKSTKESLSKLTDSYEENKKKLEQANAKYDEACEKYGKSSDQAKKLKEEVVNLEKKQTNYENRIVSTNSRLTNLQTELNNAEKEAKELGQQVDETSNKLDNFATEQVKMNLKKFGSSLETTGGKLESIGKAATSVATAFAPLSAGLIAIGTSSVKSAITFEQGMSKVKAASGASAEELALLEQKARDVAKTSTKTATDCVDALGNLALAGYGTQDMLNALDPVIKMAEAGMLDLETASDLCVNAMSTLGKGSDELEGFLDVIAQTANATTTDIDGMMEAFINCGATTKTLGVDFRETAAVLGVMGQNGTKGYEAGTKLNSILTRMTSQSTVATKAWKSLGVEVFDGAGNFRGLSTVLNETRKKLKGYNDEQTQVFLKAAVGTDNIADFKNLIDSTGGTLEDLTKQMYNAEGALDEMTKTMKDNVAGQWAGVKSQLEEVGLKIADVLLPVLSDLLKCISSLIEWFDGLPRPIQNTIVYVGMFTVALNAVIGAFGLCTSGIGGLITNIGKMCTSLGAGEVATSGLAAKIAGSGGLTSALSTAAGTGGMAGLVGALGSFVTAAAPWVVAAGSMYYAGKKIYEGFQQEVIPEVDLFADQVEYSTQVFDTSAGIMASTMETTTVKISEATKKAVGAYIDMDDGIRQELFDMQVNSEVVTDGIASSLTTKFQNMGTQIKEGFKAHMEENTGILNTFFENSKVLSETAEQDILLKTNEYYQQKIEDTETSEKRIAEIIENAKNEHRELTEQEMNEISSIQDTMRINAVNALSEQELESKVIIERMKSHSERLTAEMVAKNVKELNKQRDNAVNDANTTYDETVRAITRLRDETGAITEEQADKMIQEAGRQRDGTIKEAEKTRSRALKKVEQMSGELYDEVDTNTGEILTKWGELKNWWKNWKPKAKNFIFNMGANISKSLQNAINSGVSLGSYTDFDSPAVAPLPGDANYGVATLSDNLYVPTATEINAMARAINSTSNPSIGGSVEQISVSYPNNNDELKEVKELLYTMINMFANSGVEVPVYLNGREIARASAKYMETELNTLSNRKLRLGGAF